MTRSYRTRSMQQPNWAAGHKKRKFYGYVVEDTYPVSSQVFDRDNSYCEDYSGTPYTDSRLLIRKATAAKAVFHTNGKWVKGIPGSPTNSGEYNWASALPASGYPSPELVYSQYPVNWDDLMTQALANANPNRSFVDLPLFVFELRELPRLFRDTIDFAQKLGRSDWKGLTNVPQLGKTNLAYRFGLKPMISDMIELFNFTEIVAKRIKELRDMHAGARIERSLGVYSLPGGNYTTSSAWNYNPRCDVSGNILAKASNGPIPFTGERSVWYTMDVELLTDLPKSLEDLKGLAARSALGLDLDLTFAWNALPWTWLIDWFSNFGDFISLTRGTIQWQHRNLNIMVHDRYQAQILWQKAAGVSGPDSSLVTKEWKRREFWPAPYAWPTITIPILSKTQLGILASLAVTRQGRYQL